MRGLDLEGPQLRLSTMGWVSSWWWNAQCLPHVLMFSHSLMSAPFSVSSVDLHVTLSGFTMSFKCCYLSVTVISDLPDVHALLNGNPTKICIYFHHKMQSKYKLFTFLLFILNALFSIVFLHNSQSRPFKSLQEDGLLHFQVSSLVPCQTSQTCFVCPKAVVPNPNLFFVRSTTTCHVPNMF